MKNKEWDYAMRWGLLYTFLFLFAACSSDNEPSGEKSIPLKEYKIACILPQSNGMQARWERIAGWATQMMEEAQHDFGKGVKLSFEWYDEENTDVADCVKQLAKREDIKAVIGPYFSKNVETAAGILYGKNKPMLVPVASSAELIRKYAKAGFLWALTETDITQCEVLLSKAMMHGAKKVSMIACADLYGQTFIDWFSFQARELGLTVASQVIYTSGNLEERMNSLLASDCDYAICVPSSEADGVKMVRTYRKRQESSPRLLFSDMAHSARLLSEAGALAEGIEGVTISANPASGFEVSYQTRFGETPLTGEAQLLDAMMMLNLAAYHKEQSGVENLNDALKQIVDGREEGMGVSWTTSDVAYGLIMLELGVMPNLSGASGPLDFDATVYTNVLQTTYASWEIYNGKYITLDYNTSDGSKRTAANLAGWNWKNSQMQDIADQGNFAYPPRRENYALVIAGSNGWENYRHQADALDMYQILKASGYDDDHIILILEDDIANHALNPQKGVVQVRIGGKNVYQDAEIDYRLGTLQPEDILAILCGKSSERLPKVIEATENDNLLIFWSGHGTQGKFVWRDDRGGFTRNDMSRLMEQLNAGGKHYRKMLWLVETCYAGSVAQGGEGYPGVLFLTAANEDESSKADIYNNDLQVFMSNRFTATLEDELTQNATISLRDLYYKLFRNTVGSHVMVYNQANFDNLFNCTMEEFTVPLSSKTKRIKWQKYN